MNDEHSEDFPKTQPDFALIPPWPPKPTAQDLEDNGNRVDRGVGVRVEGCVDRAVRIQPGEVVPLDSRHRRSRAALAGRKLGEGASHQDLVVRRLDDRTDAAVGLGIERRVQRTIRVQPGDVVAERGRVRPVGLERREVPADQDLAVDCCVITKTSVFGSGLNAV